MDNIERPIHPNPLEGANCFVKACFCWTNHIFRVGYRRQLEEVDIYDVLPEDSSIKLSNDLGREWEKEVYSWRTGGHPSLFNALFRCYGQRILSIGGIFFVVETFRVVQAMFLGLILTYFEPDSGVTSHQAYLYALGLTLTHILVVLCDNLAFHKSYYYGLKMRVATTSLIYRKLLRLSHSSLQNTSTSNIVSLLSSDTHRFDQSCLGINYIWIGPIETLAIITLLWQHIGLGPFSLLGLAIIAVMAALQFGVGRFLCKIRSRISGVTEQRVRLTSEIIAGIKTLKVHCWEKAFAGMVHATRMSECSLLRTLTHIRGLNSAMYFVSGKLLMFVTFAAFLLVGGQGSVSMLFTTLVLYEILRASVSLLLPWGVQHFLEARAAVDRIQAFLLLEEKSLMDAHANDFGGPNNLVKRSPLPENVVVRLEDYTTAWRKDETSFILEGLNLTVLKGQFLAITGSPRSGKSTLLLAMTGELPRLGGFLRTRGKLGLVPESPWLLPGTVRDNIVFGADVDKRRYHRVIQACGLLPDLEALPAGDLTVLGEKETPLTNAVRVKLSLARAVYQGADTFLVDDILSQMGGEEALHIFKRCFCGILNAKTVILVTQSRQFLKVADQIVVMEKGKLQHSGSYNDLVNKGVTLGDNDSEEERQCHDNDSCNDYHQNCGQETTANDSQDTTLKSTKTISQSGTVTRNRTGVDSTYGSSESLDQLWMELNSETSESDQNADEDREPTVVASRTYRDYIHIGGYNISFVVLIVLCIVTQVAYVMCDWFLFQWAQAQYVAENPIAITTSPFFTSVPHESSPSPEDTNATIATATPINASSPPVGLTTSSAINVDPAPTWPWLLPAGGQVALPLEAFEVYLGVFMGLLLAAVLRALLVSVVACRAAQRLHNHAFKAVLRAPVAFFQRYSLGRILSRFTRDVGYLDDPLPACFFECVQFLFMVFGAFVTAAVTCYWLVLVIVPVVLLFFLGRHYYMRTARDVGRLENTAKVPIYQHMTHTLEGMWVVRSVGAQGRFLRRYDILQDRHTAASYMYLAIGRWFALRLDVVSICYVTLLPIVAIVVKEDINPGLLGISMAYAVNLIGLFQFSMRQSAELENQMAGVERLSKFADLTTEGDLVTSQRPSTTWPQYGIVTFEGVTMTTDERTRLLRNIWCCIRAEEKVGILGNPDSSSKAFVSAILRLKSLTSGTVRIDGLDIGQLGLHDLRERVAVVTQDPMLFSGSLRRNLDPFTRYPDNALWKVLEEVQLRAKVEQLPGKLYADMTDFGVNFSQGERQLLGLARALVTNAKVILLEEAASLLESRTEASIRHVLRAKFPHKTVIVIGQRLGTVIEMDRVMIVGEGRIKEFDSPHELLSNTSGNFYKMVQDQSVAQTARLVKLARDKQENRPYRPPPKSMGGEGMPYAGRATRHFLPSFQTSRLTGVLSNFTGNRFSTNRF